MRQTAEARDHKSFQLSILPGLVVSTGASHVDRKVVSKARWKRSTFPLCYHFKAAWQLLHMALASQWPPSWPLSFDERALTEPNVE
eukprot:1157601-Pelagomonas_calceolata.AAC.5